MYNLVWQSVMCRPGKRSRTTIRPQDFGTRAPPRELPSFLSVTSTSGRDRTLRVLVTTAKAAAPRVSVTWQHPTRAPVCDWMTGCSREHECRLWKVGETLPIPIFRRRVPAGKCEVRKRHLH